MTGRRLSGTILLLLGITAAAVPLAHAGGQPSLFYDTTISAIMEKYGMMLPQPESAVQQQRNDYEAAVAKLQEERQQIYQKIDALHMQADAITEEILLAEEQYGLPHVKWPDHDDATWQRYNDELSAAYLEIEQRHYAGQDLQIEGLYAEYGITPHRAVPGATDEFMAEIDSLYYEKYAYVMPLWGDHTVQASDKQWIYEIVSQKVIPEMRQIYERHGHEAPPPLSPAQAAELEQRLSEAYRSRAD